MRNGPYELIIAPTDYPGMRYRGKYAYEHHVVWWQAYGTLPQTGQQIHHKNRDKRDNRLSNLECLSAEEHLALHAHDHPAVIYQLRCVYCGADFKREKRQVISKLLVGQKNFFCTKSCQVKEQHRSGTSGIKRSPVP